MSSYEELPAFKALHKRLSLDADRAIVFVGSGLSRAAGLPDWTGLKKQIIQDYRLEADTTDEPLRSEIKRKCDTAENVDDLWLSFSLIKKIRPEASFITAIRGALNAVNKDTPLNYHRIWKLGIAGIISLNLDDFSKKAYSEVFSGRSLEDFTGKNISDFADVLTRDAPFLCDLHGRLGESSSWVMTKEEHVKLLQTKGFSEFITACFLSGTVIFVGIGADDTAAGGLLENLTKAIGVTNLGSHYWISDRSDSIATNFADRVGIGRIHYSGANGHEELEQILEKLGSSYILPKPPVVLPAGSKQRHFSQPSLEELLAINDPNQLRIRLNEIATQILGSSRPDREKKYQDFLDEYEIAISRAWFIPKVAKAPFFGYELKRLISGSGAFGRVYEAVDNNGGSFAIKLIHNDVHDKPELLEAFRRGVSSMKIVANRNVPGVVSIKQAWELPASIVMDFVPGLNLEESVEVRQIIDWGQRLQVFHQLANVLLRAHRLPEIVVHRDVRPPNVILRNFYGKGDDIDVSLVDFDLSWHRDAFGRSIQQSVGVHGYFAPEQYTQINKASSRSALVDSFGLAMTMYYVVTGKHPVVGYTERTSWVPELESWRMIYPCTTWQSLPTRISRLIRQAAQLEQAKRADMTTMVRELGALLLLYEKDKIQDIRILIEEIGHVSRCLRGGYSWDEFEGAATYVSPSGLMVSLQRQSADILCLNAEWKNLGTSQYESVKKYFTDAKGKIGAELRAKKWECEIDGNFDGLRVIANKKLVLSYIKKNDVDDLAKIVDFIIDSLTFA
ncbi:MAG: protein kinase [Akkermansiaceae bacterium]|nr:protein kinase [Akkermansiaceae bacterium]